MGHEDGRGAHEEKPGEDRPVEPTGLRTVVHESMFPASTGLGSERAPLNSPSGKEGEAPASLVSEAAPAPVGAAEACHRSVASTFAAGGRTARLASQRWRLPLGRSRRK